MKYLILIITLFSFNSIVFSQDSVSVKTEIDTFSPANYEGQFDYVFARKEPNWLGYDFLFEKTKLETKNSNGVALNFSLGLAF